MEKVEKVEEEAVVIQLNLHLQEIHTELMMLILRELIEEVEMVEEAQEEVVVAVGLVIMEGQKEVLGLLLLVIYYNQKQFHIN